jgi:predicted MFS family arabinose efflux permease
MGVMLIPMLNVTPSVFVTLGFFFVLAFFASVRSTASSGMGLQQLPGRPGSMMGARTASAQLGYMIGAAGGGLVLALADFGTLGFVLFGGMVLAGWLISRVTDPQARRRGAIRERLPEFVPD